jgi:hypothetical protein
LNQPETKVSYWFKNSDYTGNSTYLAWFAMQDDRNASIDVADRFTHIRSDGTPAFDSYTGPATLLINDSQIVDPATMADVYKSGGTPIDIAVGDFWEDNPGDEIAVIWDAPVSKINGINYYTIIIYDSNGIEVNRCGKSLTKWKAITAGNFISLKGDEIAAIPDAAIDGKYPIYVFARGRKIASVTNLPTNTIEINALTGGNFNTGTDGYDEIAFVYSNSQKNINYCKPTLTSWSSTSTGAVTILNLAGGNFDGDASNGDEVAMIRNTRKALVYLYRPGAATYYATVGPDSGPTFGAIAAGNFDGDAADEIAVSLETAVNGEYQNLCYNQDGTTYFKELSQNVQGVTAKAIAACDMPVYTTLGLYERAQGFTSSNYGSTMSSWGDCVAVLPSAAQTTNAIPVFLLNANPASSTQEYLKVVPIVR